jgi:hypothetical protein
VIEDATANCSRPDLCAICGNRKNKGETWFPVTQNEWEDRLNVWNYENLPGHKEITRAVCGPKHLRELVAHWMSTGCLQYPFASSRERVGHGYSLAPDADHRISTLPLCEIALDREGILHAQRDNPLALNAILDEMLLALEPETHDQALEDFEDPGCFTIPEAE